jgi:hypothetical protein
MEQILGGIIFIAFVGFVFYKLKGKKASGGTTTPPGPGPGGPGPGPGGPGPVRPPVDDQIER